MNRRTLIATLGAAIAGCLTPLAKASKTAKLADGSEKMRIPPAPQWDHDHHLVYRNGKIIWEPTYCWDDDCPLCGTQIVYAQEQP